MKQLRIVPWMREANEGSQRSAHRRKGCDSSQKAPIAHLVESGDKSSRLTATAARRAVHLLLMLPRDLRS